jgi:signal transduction histidine kinase/CheY-like chemotaxis protein
MRPSVLTFLGLVFGLALAGPANRLHAAGPVKPTRVGVLTDNFPYSFQQPDGQLAGFSYELVRELELAMGLNFERIVGPTDRIAREFAEGRVDLLQSLAEFPEREKTADFSVPYLRMTGSIFVRTGETGVRALADLRGRRVLVHRGSLGETVLRRAGLAESIVIVPSVEEALKRLDRGEGDATLASHLTGLTLVHHLGLKGVKSLGAKIDGYDVRYCIAVQEGDRELLAQVNEGLAVLVRTGRYDEIYRKWFGQVVPTGYTTEQVVGAVAIGLALALIVAVWAGAKQRALRKHIAQQAEALRVSEERHRGIFEGTHEGLLVLGRNGTELTVEQINPAARQLLAAAPTVVTGQPVVAWLATDPVLSARVQSAGLAGRTEEFEHERPGGGWLRVAVSPLGGRALVALTDITDQMQARERLRRQEEQIRLKQKLEAVGTLAGGVAHDFNNLLTPIMGNTELCLLSLPPDHPEVGGLQQVQRAARRARDLVRQILTFSRQADPGREVVALGPIIAETINLLRTLARGAVEFESVLAADLPPILADPGQVHQVLMNIGTNAVQAVRGTAGQVAFRAEAIDVGPELQQQHPALRAGTYVRLGIQDNGPGMTPEVQRRVFEPFFTTKLPGEGTGLGLSVVHGIMEQHGGLVTLYSQSGRGTLFHLYFPTASSAADAAPAGAAAAPLPLGRGEAVLFVDDDQNIVAMVRKMMERLGYEVSAHDHAEQAWAEYVAKPGKFAVVVSDLTMPGMNGLLLLSRVRSLSATQPFVLSSGFFSEAERHEATSLGVSLLLPKPLGYGELARAVAAALARR